MKSFVLPLAAWFSCATALESAAIDYISPRGKIAIDDNKGWESLSQNVLSKPYEPKRFPNGMYVSDALLPKDMLSREP